MSYLVCFEYMSSYASMILAESEGIREKNMRANVYVIGELHRNLFF